MVAQVFLNHVKNLSHLYSFGDAEAVFSEFEDGKNVTIEIPLRI